MIEWKATLSNRVLTRDTERDLDLRSSFYWQGIKKKTEHIVHLKKHHDQQVRSDDTMIVVSVHDCSQHDLTKCFENTDIS